MPKKKTRRATTTQGAKSPSSTDSPLVRALAQGRPLGSLSPRHRLTIALVGRLDVDMALRGWDLLQAADQELTWWWPPSAWTEDPQPPGGRYSATMVSLFLDSDGSPAGGAAYLAGLSSGGESFRYASIEELARALEELEAHEYVGARSVVGPVGPEAGLLRVRDGQSLGEAALLVENAATAITDALAVLSRTSLVINLARSTSELNRPLPQLQELARVLEFAGAALIDNGELATRPDRPVELGAHISPHQIDLFARLAEFNAETVRLDDVYDQFGHDTERTQPRKQTAPPVSTVDERYQTSLRNELQGNDVGAEAFWNAVQSLPCTYCEAKAGKPCMTSGGWPSLTYHRPRRDEAATQIRKASR